MIQANELRIGNWVIYHGDTDMYCQLDAQDIFNISTGYMENDKIHSPIPLTPDILEELGFEKRKNGNFMYRIVYLDKYMIIGFYENGIYPSLIQEGELVSEPTSVFSLNRIENIHQLQNLIFALTGQELEWKRK